MSKLLLKDYFTPHGQRRALEEYGKFARTSPHWSVKWKMELYDLAREAFSREGNFAAFEQIYDGLRRYWQVFRSPNNVEEPWDEEHTFDALRRELHEFHFASGVSLMNMHHSKRHTLMFSLMALDRLKPNIGYPTMAVSKFAHFYNPSLFPIWDNEVVQGDVFACFRNDYRAFCNSADLPTSAEGAAFLRNYVCWASELITTAAASFMPFFVNWVKDELPRERTLDPAFVSTLYATAFEFTAIGAAKAQGYVD